VVPWVMLFVWMNALKVQMWRLTTLHILLAVFSVILSWWFISMRVRAFMLTRNSKLSIWPLHRLLTFSAVYSLLLGVASFVAFTPFTRSSSRSLIYKTVDRILAFADIKVAPKVPGFEFSTKPPLWTGKLVSAQDEIALVKGGELSGRSLRRIEAPRSFLVQAHVNACDLFGANFEYADFRASHVENTFAERGNYFAASFSSRASEGGKILTKQKASPAYIEKCSFDGSVFTRAYFEWITAYRSNFRKVTFDYVAAAESKWVDCDFASANLSFSSFEGASFEGDISFKDCVCRNTSFRKAKFGRADVTGADFTHCAFDGADLSEVIGLTLDQLNSTAGHEGAITPNAWR